MNCNNRCHSLRTACLRWSLSAPVVTLLLLGGASVANAGDWSWTVTPYAWATDIGVDVRIADQKVVEEEIPVSDLLEDLDTIVQLRVEAQRGSHGVMADLFDVTLSDEESGVGLPNGAGHVALDSDVGMTILDLAGFYDPKGDQQGISFLYGTRVLNQRATIDATFRLAADASVQRSYETDETLVDVLVGVRLHRQFSRRWAYQLQVDVSLGGTEYTWSAGPSLSYVIGKTGRYAITAGYRHMKIDFEDDDELDAEMTMSGALVGLHMSF